MKAKLISLGINVYFSCLLLTFTFSFHSRDWGHCLNDEPTAPEFDFPVLPPGVMYDVQHQCRLQYGPQAQFCFGIDVSTHFINMLIIHVPQANPPARTVAVPLLTFLLLHFRIFVPPFGAKLKINV